MDRPRIILADDHRVFAEGLQAMLDDEFHVVSIVESGRALLEAVAMFSPELVVMDISMPELNGIECVRRLRESTPELKIVLLTMHDDLGFAIAAIRAGASGYVLKNSGVKDLLFALREALDGGTHISPQIAKEVMLTLATGEETRPQLSQRQVEILRLLADGLSAKQIAARMHISPRTVEFHKYQAMERLGVSTSAELIAYTTKLGSGPM